MLIGAFKKLDGFLAKHVFHPPVIAYCQATGYTQYSVNRDLWFVAFALVMLDMGISWWLVLAGPVTILLFLRASLLPREWPEVSLGIFRWFWGFFLVMDITIGNFLPAIYHLVIIFAEYAATIPTIPPKKRKEPKRKLAKATARG